VHRLWLGAFLAIGLLPRLEGQTIQLRPGPFGASTCSFDTAAVRDTILYTLFLAARNPADSTQFEAVLRGIAASFVAPSRVSVPLWPGTHFPDDSGNRAQTSRANGAGPFTGELRIDFARGKVERARWQPAPGSPELQAAVLEAVQRADSEASSGLLPAAGGRRTRARLTLRTATRRELVRGVPILRLRMPFIRIEQPVAILHIPTPALPANSQERGLGSRAHVDLQYVVTEDGRASRTSIKVLQADDSAFAASAREAILAGLFQPARTRGCPVQMLVQQRVSYRF
jgi:hypothetical protein